MSTFCEEKVGTRKGESVVVDPIAYTLSISEATAYFGIGEKKIRKLIQEHPEADFVLMNSTHVRIKKKQFEKFIDEATAI